MDTIKKISFGDIARMRQERIAGALFYARRGFYVFPCCDPGMAPHKHSGKPCTTPGKGPLIKWGEGATVDPATIVRLWSRWPTANIAIATGERSGIIVVDLDPRNGGLESWGALIKQFGDITPTWTVRSGGGGLHFYFKHPGGWIKSNPIAPGVDIKADGGSIIAPPSIHHSGGVYVWQ